MTSQPETEKNVVCELVLAELERHERANAPTLKDLRKAAQQSGLALVFTDQQAKTEEGSCRADRKSVR
jgi:hypothetical protein